MPKRNRLTGADIRRLTSEKRLNSSLFSLTSAPLPQDRGAVAFIVSKKVSLKAVVRNRVKRRMRSVFRKVLPLPLGKAYILTARPGAALADYLAVEKDILQLIERIRSMK